jgi:hypothetical protein
MDANEVCPTCGASWAREEYQPIDRIIVTCRNEHRFLVGELRHGGLGTAYLRLTPLGVDESEA